MPPVFWIQRQDIGPSARSGHAMAFDAGRNRVVLFGGSPGGNALADTWEWDGSLWTQVADTGPSPRAGAAMAHAASAGRIFLFGGAYGANLAADTWTFDGTDWIQVADTGPSPRSGHAMAYDQARARLVLFGGHDGSPLGDTWEWDGSGWVQVQDTGPAGRHGHVLAYDAGSQRVVLFGGADPSGAGLDDTWSWNGTTWTQAADTGPAGRVGAGVSGGGSVLLFGGVNSVDGALASADRVVYRDTWRWSTDGWVQLQDIGPAPRWGHGMAFRPASGRTVLFGGSASFASAASDLLADTWEVPDQAGANPNPDPNNPDPNNPNPGGVVEVATVDVQPQLVSVAGQPLDVSVVLTGPANPGSTLTIAVFQIVGGTPTLLDPSGYFIPNVGFNGGELSAQFQLVPDGTVVLSPGDYAVGVGMGPGQMQGGFFQVT